MQRGDTKKRLWDDLVAKEKGARTARFGRRVVVTMRNRRSQRRRLAGRKRSFRR